MHIHGWYLSSADKNRPHILSEKHLYTARSIHWLQQYWVRTAENMSNRAVKPLFLPDMFDASFTVKETTVCKTYNCWLDDTAGYPKRVDTFNIPLWNLQKLCLNSCLWKQLNTESIIVQAGMLLGSDAYDLFAYSGWFCDHYMNFYTQFISGLKRTHMYKMYKWPTNAL